MAQMRDAAAGLPGCVASFAMRSPKPAGPPPTETTLRAAALAHLARYAATQAGLVRVLDRRVMRWAQAAENTDPDIMAAARQAVRKVAARLVADGVVDDAVFAESRARSLTRAGRSRRAVAAHLAARGVPGAVAQTALPDDPEAELAAALAFARRRRIGPFRRDAEAADTLRELGMLARAGFAQEVASQALRLDPVAAEDLLLRLKQS